jgi:hypothetical protein
MSSIFSTILDKLGIHKKDEAKEAVKPATPSAGAAYTPGQASQVRPPAGKPSPRPNVPYTPGGNYPQPAKPNVPYTPPAPASTAPATPAVMAEVDVAAHLDYLAKTGPIQGLNWRMSINDLMALIGIPHTAKDIKDLAVELGCPEKEMGDSYSRNVWTHKALLKKIAENGGKVPQELLN